MSEHMPLAKRSRGKRIMNVGFTYRSNDLRKKLSICRIGYSGIVAQVIMRSSVLAICNHCGRIIVVSKPASGGLGVRNLSWGNDDIIAVEFEAGHEI